MESGLDIINPTAEVGRTGDAHGMSTSRDAVYWGKGISVVGKRNVSQVTFAPR